MTSGRTGGRPAGRLQFNCRRRCRCRWTNKLSPSLQLGRARIKLVAKWNKVASGVLAKMK